VSRMSKIKEAFKLGKTMISVRMPEQEIKEMSLIFFVQYLVKNINNVDFIDVIPKYETGE